MTGLAAPGWAPGPAGRARGAARGRPIARSGPDTVGLLAIILVSLAPLHKILGERPDVAQSGGDPGGPCVELAAGPARPNRTCNVAVARPFARPVVPDGRRALFACVLLSCRTTPKRPIRANDAPRFVQRALFMNFRLAKTIQNLLGCPSSP